MRWRVIKRGSDVPMGATRCVFGEAGHLIAKYCESDNTTRCWPMSTHFGGDKACVSCRVLPTSRWDGAPTPQVPCRPLC
uniref:Uncharacterized protein n=1 Tax=Ralstonia solanacearum CFBP2957 TaxID=859656 RepID=D8P2V8_RALSL|nr:protein of unknown function [Ralstonia solanacearum CFBP2957]